MIAGLRDYKNLSHGMRDKKKHVIPWDRRDKLIPLQLLFSFANLGGEGTCVLGSRCGNAAFIGLLQLLCEESSGRVVLELGKTMGVAERTVEPQTFYIQKAGVDEEGSIDVVANTERQRLIGRMMRLLSLRSCVFGKGTIGKP